MHLRLVARLVSLVLLVPVLLPKRPPVHYVYPESSLLQKAKLLAHSVALDIILHLLDLPNALHAQLDPTHQAVEHPNASLVLRDSTVLRQAVLRLHAPLAPYHLQGRAHVLRVLLVPLFLLLIILARNATTVLLDTSQPMRV